MNHVLQVLHYMGGFAPLGLGVLFLLGMAGPSRYNPPPNGGPGGDMGIGKQFRKVVRHFLQPNDDEG